MGMNDTMKLTIRRGAHEIGGSCIELEAAGRRIVLDLGMPLVAPWDRKLKLESREFTRLPTAEVRKAGLLPAGRRARLGSWSEQSRTGLIAGLI